MELKGVCLTGENSRTGPSAYESKTRGGGTPREKIFDLSQPDEVLNDDEQAKYRWHDILESQLRVFESHLQLIKSIKLEGSKDPVIPA